MPVIETLIDGLRILGIAVVIGDTRKLTKQIGGEQQRGNYGDRSGGRGDRTHSGYHADDQAHGAVRNVLGNLPSETSGNSNASDQAARPMVCQKSDLAATGLLYRLPS